MANIAARSGWNIASSYQSVDNTSILDRLLSREYMFVKYPVEISNDAKQLYFTLWEFMNDFVFPSERLYRKTIEEKKNFYVFVLKNNSHFIRSQEFNELKTMAKKLGLWNFMYEKGFKYTELVLLAEVIGRSPISQEIFNCRFSDLVAISVMFM